MSNPNTVVFSHSQDSGYSSVDLSGIIADKEAADWIGSYVKSTTAFASNPKYLSAVSSVNSFFSRDNYMVFLESCNKKDNRLYLESRVTVNTVNAIGDLSVFMDNAYIKSIDELKLAKEDREALKKALLLAAVSDKTTVFCVGDSDDILDGVRKEFFTLPPGVLCRSSCIEAVGGIPELRASLVLCKCIDSEDYTSYINTIKSRSNYILIDCMGERVRITADIPQTTYAQRVINYIVDFRNPSVDNMCKIFHTTVRAVKGLSVFDFSVDKNTYLNTVAYFVLANNYAPDLYSVYATADEKENISKYVSSRGILK